MFFHALTFAMATGSCLSMRPRGGGFKLLPRDTENLTKNNLNNIKKMTLFAQKLERH